MHIHDVKIQMLELFTNPVWKEDAEMLRLAVNGKWSDREILHGHDAVGKSAYRFPLIRYIPRKNPVIVGLDGSLDVLVEMYQAIGKTIKTPNSIYTIEASELRGQDFLFGESSELLELSTLSPWFGLNASNYKSYIKTDDIKKRISMLESVWIGNILSAAKGLGIVLDFRVMVKIIDLKEKSMIIKNTPMLAFNANIVSNVIIPQYLGIGKHAALGFGRWGR